MHYTSREKRKHPEDWGGLLLPLDFFEVWILDLSETHCRWMHFWNGGHLRSAPVSRQGTKKRRENWEKEYVSGSGYKQKPTYNRSRKKRGHPSTYWDYCFETRHHIGNLGLLFWNASLAFLAQQLYNIVNATYEMYERQHFQLSEPTLHILVFSSPGNVKMLQGRKSAYFAS